MLSTSLTDRGCGAKSKCFDGLRISALHTIDHFPIPARGLKAEDDVSVSLLIMGSVACRSTVLEDDEMGEMNEILLVHAQSSQVRHLRDRVGSSDTQPLNSSKLGPASILPFPLMETFHWFMSVSHLQYHSNAAGATSDEKRDLGLYFSPTSEATRVTGSSSSLGKFDSSRPP